MADAGASDASASAAPVLPSPAPPAPLGLPSKLKERWNAAYDPSAPGTAKRARKEAGAYTRPLFGLT